MKMIPLAMLVYFPALTLFAVEPEAWLELSDGSRIPGRPLGRSGSTVYWQLSDPSGYAEIPYSVESVDSIEWRQSPPVDAAGSVMPCPAREGYWDLLSATEKRQWFGRCLEWIYPEGEWCHKQPIDTDRTVAAVRIMRALRQGRVDDPLKRRILEEESIALIDLGLADVASANVDDLRKLLAEDEVDSLVLYIRAAAERERGDSLSAMRLATAGFLQSNYRAARWRALCAGLAIRLMEANGLSENAQLLRRSANSQRLPIDDENQREDFMGGREQ